MAIRWLRARLSRPAEDMVLPPHSSRSLQEVKTATCLPLWLFLHALAITRHQHLVQACSLGLLFKWSGLIQRYLQRFWKAACCVSSLVQRCIRPGESDAISTLFRKWLELKCTDWEHQANHIVNTNSARAFSPQPVAEKLSPATEKFSPKNCKIYSSATLASTLQWCC